MVHGQTHLINVQRLDTMLSKSLPYRRNSSRNMIQLVKKPALRAGKKLHVIHCLTTLKTVLPSIAI
jgi:hypothetical protein